MEYHRWVTKTDVEQTDYEEKTARADGKEKLLLKIMLKSHPTEMWDFT